MVACSTGPRYDRSAFVRACSIPGGARIRKEAREDAKRYFDFETETRILGYIACGGLDDELQHDNTAPLENGPPQDIGRPVDGYTFRMGDKYVYIAFYVNFKGLWIIKSLHPPTVGERTPSLTYKAFASLEDLK